MINESFFKRNIASRSWEKIRSGWIEEIDFNIEDDIQRNPPLKDYDSVCLVLDGINKEITLINDDFFYERAFREAILLYYKSLHVLKIVEHNSRSGNYTWMLVNAYYSAYFAAKSVLAICGVTPVQYQKKTFIFDCWGEMNNNTQNVAKIVFCEHRFGHTDFWKLFERLINSLRCDFTPKKLKYLTKKNFENQYDKFRNLLQYDAGYWTYDDLYRGLSYNPFDSDLTLMDIKSFKNNPAIILHINVEIIFFSRQLFVDLLKKYNIIDYHRNKISESLSEFDFSKLLGVGSST